MPSLANNFMAISSKFGPRDERRSSSSRTTCAKRRVSETGSCFSHHTQDGSRKNFLSTCRAHVISTTSIWPLAQAALCTRSKALARVCWVSLALLWFGQSEAAMLFVVVMGTLWSVVIATDTGVRNVPPIYRRAALTMGSKRLHMWFRVILPAALPFIVSGMKQGWAFAWRSLMAAEIFVTILTGFGLGQLLHYGRELSAMEQVIGIMIVIVVIGLLADKIFFSPIERFLHRRWGTSQA